MCAYMGHPEICPDGNPIGQGKCCLGETSPISYRDYIPLSELKEGDNGIIKVILLTQDIKDRLSYIGLIPDSKVTVKRKLGKGTLSIITRDFLLFSGTIRKTAESAEGRREKQQPSAVFRVLCG